MAITGSPDVFVQEQDLSSYVSADSVTTGAVVGCFEWGPTFDITKITSEARLLQYFGKPYDYNYKDWYTARNFLNYSSSLAVVRVLNDGATNASDTAEDIRIDNYSMFDFINKKSAQIIARYPGEKGNKIRVAMYNKAYIDEQKELQKLGMLQGGIKHLAYETIKRPLTEMEVAVVVYVDDVLQESGIFSLLPDATDSSGYGNFLFKYFNNNSNWIYLIQNNFGEKFEYQSTMQNTGEIYTDEFTVKWFDEKGNFDFFEREAVVVRDENDLPVYLPDGRRQHTIEYVLNEDMSRRLLPINIDVTLGGGYSDNEISLGAYQKGWNLFYNEETEDADVQLLMQGGGDIAVGNYIIDIANTRMDCVACVSPMLEEVVNTLNPVDNIINGSGAEYQKSSYAFMDGNYKYQYDIHNDVYRWMPLNGDIAGIMAETDVTEDPWMSPGGKSIKNCVKLAYNPTKAERDILFEHNVNPVTNFRAEGNILWGDWTRVDNTAFNFIGVRRMFLYIERAIKEYARNVMWKQNDELTETLFIQTVEPFLRTVQGGRGIQDFKVYAGASVTSPEEMDRGIFRAKILVKPVRSIRYVVLVFSAVRSDMSIEEVVQ